MHNPKSRLIVIVSLLLFFVGATYIVAQQGMSDGKRLYNYGNDYLVIPTHPVQFVPAPTTTPGLINGALAVDGSSVYVVIGGVWRKIATTSPTATPTPSSTATSTPTPTP